MKNLVNISLRNELIILFIGSLTMYYMSINRSFFCFFIFSSICIYSIIKAKKNIIVTFLLLSSTINTLFIFPNYISSNLGVGRVLTLIYLIIIIYECIKKRIQLKVSYLLLGCILLLINTTSIFMSYNIQVSIQVNSIMLLNIALFVFIPNDQTLNFELIGKYFSYGCSILMLLISFKIFGNDFENYGLGFVFVDNVNKNRFAIGLTIMGITILIFALSVKNLIKKSFFIVMYIISIYSLLLSGSRTATFSLIVASTIYILFYLKKIKIIKKVTFILILFCMAIVVYSLFIESPYIEGILDRYSLTTLSEDKGSMRFDTWQAMLNDIIPKHLFTGIGIGSGAESKTLEHYGYLPIPSHNMYISILAQLGLLSFMIYIGCFVYLVLKGFLSINKKKYIAIFLFILIALLFNGIGEEIYTDRIIWIVSGIIYGYNNQKKC